MAPTVTRPLAHLTAPSGWVNDPLGLTVHDGRYHLFFQHVPDSLTWQPTCHWGHAVSEDLVTWEHRPIALAPGEGDGGIWSGSLVLDNAGEARIYYTAVRVPDFARGSIRVARPRDETWDVWDKGETVVPAPGPEEAVAFRDPFVMRDGEGWRMLVGTALPGNVAAARAFTSIDQRRWDDAGLLAARPSAETEPVWTGSLWECPQLLEVDGATVMVTSVWEDDELHHVAYALGELVEGRFEVASWHRLSHGESYYAPSVFRDAEGEPGIIFWLRGATDPEAGWAGALSVPHRLSLRDGRLHLEPHPQVRAQLPAADTVRWEDWDPAREDLRLTAADGTDLTLRREDEGIVEIDGEGTRRPLGPAAEGTVPVLVDGPVAEIALGPSVHAVARAADLAVRCEASVP